MERDLSTGQTAQITDGTLGTERGDLSGGQIGDPRFNVGRGHENTKSGGRVRSRGPNEAENEVSPLLGRKKWALLGGNPSRNRTGESAAASGARPEERIRLGSGFPGGGGAEPLLDEAVSRGEAGSVAGNLAESSGNGSVMALVVVLETLLLG